MHRALLSFVLAAACSEGATLLAPLPDGGPPTPRKVRKAAVRAYPPHAIRSDGIGPYVVDAPFSRALRELPEGPHYEILHVGRVLDWKLVRTEEGGALLIGGDGGASGSRVGFVAALDAKVAHTDNGMGVGKTVAELIEALGPEKITPGVARDHRELELERLPNVRFITDAPPDAPPARARVMAVLVTRPRDDDAVPEVPPDAPDAGARPAAPCPRPAALPASVDEIFAMAHAAPGALIAAGCVSGDQADAVVLSGEELTLVVGEAGKLRRSYVAQARRGDFLALLDVDRDGRDEIVVGEHRSNRSEAAVELQVWRWDGARLEKALDEPALVVSEKDAAAAGVTPPQVRLLVELRAARGGLELSGLFWAETFTKNRVLAPIAPVLLRLESRRPRPETPDPRDAGPPPPAAAPPDGGRPKGAP
jgi:hypothetical protein